jgi:hypothetical protein
MADEPVRKAHELADKLEAEGKKEEAARLRATINGPVDGLLFALREFCQTLLTAVEAFDMSTEALVEDLRTEVESHLRRHGH